MHCHEHEIRERARRTGSRLALVLSTLVAVLVSLFTWGGTASAHGSVIDPASRNYGCWQRWGSDFQNPAMAEQDPMCWQAWQANPNGQLCSGGQTEAGRYNSLDAVGPWKTTDIGADFTVKLYDQASHGADYFLVYVTRQGFDPTKQPLTWNDLQLVARTGKYAPSQNYSIPLSTSGYSGRHVVYTIWQASHMDQTYFLCSDVNFR
ncbi:lytic polysaccharide monooxygenase auxiliary activity family 9 protein [Streptomyces sp. NRRL WC-3744]|uniref:lytic polysaccharide monooxygenase auxiliary activity family 9 protein n=1 Tax=Streptomyces sp. NRRL WC-3744 TaxID=1463935 RepID=UPI0004C61C10|nr:lytic polysaccharide monooxygenase [Streptomyces sp. NRRL WC-3744]